MTSPADSLTRGLVRYMLHVPVHIDPILHRARFRGRDLRPSEIMVVMALATFGPLSPTKIAERLNMQKGSLSSVLRRLERLGLIARRRSATDDRSYTTALTPDGADLAEHLSRDRQRSVDLLFSTMDPADVGVAARGLELIAAHLERLEEEMARTDTTSGGQHWYYAASPEDRQEYDAYGPWVVEVRDEADMSPRFRAFYAEDSGARLLLKFPRKEERRELRPGMDLYRCVIALHDEGVRFRQLVTGKVETQDIPWDRIVAIRCHNDLLLGHWTLLLGDGTEVDQTFNRVASDVMNKATDFVRAHLSAPASAETTGQGAPGAIELPANEVFFGSVLNEIERRGPEPATPIHFEPQGAVVLRGDDRSRVATGVLIIETPGELVLVSRDEAVRDADEASYASNDLFLPFNRMTAFAMDEPEPGDDPPFPLLSLHLGRQLVRQSCRTAPKAVVATLEARGVPRVSDR